MYDAADRTPPAEDREYFSIADLARAVVGKRLWLAVLIPILASGVAAGASLLKPPCLTRPPPRLSWARGRRTRKRTFRPRSRASRCSPTRWRCWGCNRSMGRRRRKRPPNGGRVRVGRFREPDDRAGTEDTRFLSLAYQDDDADAARAVANGAARVFARVLPQRRAGWRRTRRSR